MREFIRQDSAIPQFACECCGRTEYSIVSIKRGWRLWECQNCGVVFVWPQPSLEQLAFIYSNTAGYFIAQEQTLPKTSSFGAVDLHHQLHSLGLKSGRLLDVGCEYGSFIFHMQKLGWEVEGIDVNIYAVEVARRNNLRAHIGEIQTHPFQNASFDVIRMGDVIEHGRSPRQMMLAAHRLLKPGGFIVIRTPNANSSFARATLKMSKLMRFPWPHSEAPYHLYEFTPQSISILITSTGFNVVSIKDYGYINLLYKIGASGFFDQLKLEMKRDKHRKIYWNYRKLLLNFPKLLGVTGLILPFFLYALMKDKVTGKGNSIYLIGKKGR